MGNVTGTPTWEENVYQFETTDVVLGGPEGIDNVPLKQLANRTAFLKNTQQRGKESITLVTTSKTLTADECANKLVYVNADGNNLTLTLPTLAVGDAGFVVAIFCYNVTGNQVILNKSGNNFLLVPDVRTALFFGNGDSAELLWDGSAWVVFDFKGNFINVGKAEFDYKQRPNTVIANGALLNRSQYPRLFEFAQSLGSSFVTDAVWTSYPGYKGMFSSGNNTTTFRVPDLRSMFIRGLDLGAGISYGRNMANAGGYEADELKEHDHDMYFKKRSATGDDGNFSLIDSKTQPSVPGTNTFTFKTRKTGGTETRSKNIGLVPLILV